MTLLPTAGIDPASAGLQAAFAEAAGEGAWNPTRRTADDIMTRSPDNRLVCEP